MKATVLNSVAVGGIISSIVTVTVLYWMTRERGLEVCETKECVNAAAHILNGMDTSVNPCEEFYQYACGGWIASNPIPDDKSSISRFTVVVDENAKALQKLLNSSSDTSDREAIKKVKMFFMSCMDEDSIEDLGARPALDFIKKVRGMPLFGDELTVKRFSKVDTYLAAAKNRVPDQFRLRATAPIISTMIRPDDKDSKKHIIVFDEPKLGMPGRDYYMKEEFNSSVAAYRQYMTDYLGELWKSKEKETNTSNYNEEALKSAVDEIIQLETEMAKIMIPEAERSNIVARYKKFTVQEMSDKVSAEFNWLRFARQVMSKVGIPVKPTTEVVSYATQYFSKLMPILEKYGNRVVKNYIMWYELHQRVNLLPKKFRDTAAMYRKATTGTSKERPRWQTCTINANEYLPMPLGALYVQNLFAEKSKQVMEEMVTYVLKYFKDGLPALDWMDEKTKTAAEVKVDAFRKLLAYPDYIIDKDDPRLDQEHQDLIITEGKYFENEDNLYRFVMKTNLKKLRKPVDREEWNMGPATVNAYYNPNRNVIAFAAAILQPPFFGPHVPYAMKYGAVGHAIGHELTHGFDTTGSTFNAEGNLVNWWSNFSRKNFDAKAQCVKDQYSGFFYKPAQMFINGNLTIGENVADLGGIRVTYGGYQQWMKDNKDKEFTLPGLEQFTPEQLFFIGTGQVWCAAERPADAKKRVATARHSPGVFRVEGSVMNFDAFGKAFGCKRGQDRLLPEPEDTCRVW